MAFDFKKEYRDLYQPKTKPSIIEVPAMRFIAVEGAGDPNEEGGAYQSALELLSAAGLEVDDLVSASDGFPRKPDPAMVAELLRRHDLDPADVLMVGDRPADVEAAASAGVLGVLLVTAGMEHGQHGIRRVGALEELLGPIGSDRSP